MFVRDKTAQKSMTQTLVLGSPEENRDIFAKAAEVLLAGGLVVYPTDTSYGLACDPRIETALHRLFKVKIRRPEMGLPLLFADMAQCEQYHEFNELEKILARIFWPGPLTIVVTPNRPLSQLITGKHNTVAMRVSAHPVPCEIARCIESPIVGTSANISGGPSPFELSIAKEQLGDNVDLYIDGGPSPATANSTIVGVDAGPPSNIIVYREGQIPIDRLTADLRVQPDAMRLWSNRIFHAEM